MAFSCYDPSYRLRQQSPAQQSRLHLLLDSLRFPTSVSLNAHPPQTTLLITFSPFDSPSSSAPPPTLTESGRTPSAVSPSSTFRSSSPSQLPPGIVRSVSPFHLPITALSDPAVTQSDLHCLFAISFASLSTSPRQKRRAPKPSHAFCCQRGLVLRFCVKKTSGRRHRALLALF